MTTHGVETDHDAEVPSLIVTSRCPVCDKDAVVRPVPAEGFRAWVDGGQFIQRALPELTAEQRETLLTGAHAECQDAMFPDDADPWEPDYGQDALLDDPE